MTIDYSPIRSGVRPLSAGRRPSRGLRNAAVARIREMWTAYRREVKIRRAITDLSELDDRTLRDIGLHRGAIVGAVRGELPERSASEAIAYTHMFDRV
jgi:uncharacterized protein YjiS (DUF1127 family)